MTTVKSTYFKGRGCAETIRWMLAAAGMAFENVRLKTPEVLTPDMPDADRFVV